MLENEDEDSFDEGEEENEIFAQNFNQGGNMNSQPQNYFSGMNQTAPQGNSFNFNDFNQFSNPAMNQPPINNAQVNANPFMGNPIMNQNPNQNQNFGMGQMGQNNFGMTDMDGYPSYGNNNGNQGMNTGFGNLSQPPSYQQQPIQSAPKNSNEFDAIFNSPATQGPNIQPNPQHQLVTNQYSSGDLI